MSAQKLAEKSANILLGNDKFSSWLGIELIEVKPGRAVIKMVIRKEMLNGFDICHGGVIFSFADSAFAFASNTHGEKSVSIENSITYVNPTYEGDLLTAVAEEVSSGNKIAAYDIKVYKSDNTLVSLFRGLVYRTKKVFTNITENND